MAGFSDLVLKASGNTGGRLADVNLDGTEGRTWHWDFTDITDAAGDPVDLTSATIVCRLVQPDAVHGAEIKALTATGGVGTLTVAGHAFATSGLAAGATARRPRICAWHCTATLGEEIVQFWGPTGSTFRIYPE